MKKLFFLYILFVCIPAFAMQEGLLQHSGQKGYKPSVLDVAHLTWSPVKIKNALQGKPVQFNDHILHKAVDSYCQPNTIH